MIRLLLLAIALLGWRPAAEACSCSPPSIIISPVNGAKAVPTNAQFVFGTFSNSGRVTPLRIELYESTPKPTMLDSPQWALVETFLTGSTAQRFTAATLLKPSTDYQLSSADGRRSNFRTAAGPDTVPPFIAGFSVTGGGTPPIQPPGFTCGGYTQWLKFNPVDAADDSTTTGELTWDFYSASSPEQVDLSLAPLSLGREAMLVEGWCGFTNFPVAQTRNLAGMLVAVDLAGNRSKPTPVQSVISVGRGCASVDGLLPFAALLLLTFRERSRRV